MSFGNMKLLSGVQEVLSLALILVTMLALFYVEMDFTLKIAVGIFAFTIIILVNMATVVLRQQKEMREQQVKQA